MKWEPAVCPNCGANISVKPGGKEANCPYCNTDFVASEATAKFSATYMINYVNAENVYINQKRDFEIIAGTLVNYYGESVDVAIPDGVQAIDRNVFRGKGIRSVTVQGSVGVIGPGAFSECKQLERVILQEGLAAIEAAAFYGCERLKMIDLPYTLKNVDNDAFSYTAIEEITLPAGVKIHRGAFKGAPLRVLYLKESCAEFSKRTSFPGWHTKLKKIVATDGVFTADSIARSNVCENAREFWKIYDDFTDSPIGEAIREYGKKCGEEKRCPICGRELSVSYARMSRHSPKSAHYSCTHCVTQIHIYTGFPYPQEDEEDEEDSSYSY